MIIGALLIGTLVGTVSGLIALIFGASIWMAFLIYAILGALGALATTMIFLLQGALANREKYAIGQDLSPFQRG